MYVPSFFRVYEGRKILQLTNSLVEKVFPRENGEKITKTW